MKTLTIGALVVLLIFGAIGAGNPTRVTAEGELTHLYLFNGDLDDELNGPDLVSDGGTVSGGRYVFDENEGLSLAGALEDTADYSIVIVMQFATLSGYQKVIDFENLSEDYGLYTYDNYVTFYNEADGVDLVLLPNVDFQIILTRSGLNGETKVYLNGALQLTFTDDASLAVSSLNLLRFFVDDETTDTEAAPGSAACIGIYDGPLTEDEIDDIGTGACGQVALPTPTATSTTAPITPTTSPRPPNIGAGLSGLFNGQPTPLPTAPSAVAPAATAPTISPPRTGDAGLIDAGTPAVALIAATGAVMLGTFAFLRAARSSA